MEHTKALTLIEKYLKRAAYRPELFSEPVFAETKAFIVIPSYDEESILPCLNSLYACDPFDGTVDIILIVNDREDSSKSVKEKSKNILSEARTFKANQKNSPFNLLIHYADNLEKKHGGVGLARKIGMDEAVRRAQKISNPTLPIICLDADCLVKENYINSILDYFHIHSKCPGASIYFEHELKKAGIIFYELFLRYYINALRYAKYPYSYHTVGSSMAVRVNAYVLEGGMNRRKAGEDFYFIHKIIPRGNFGEINTTCVYPDARQSDRVPFGTGRAMMEFESQPEKITHTYNFQVFKDLREIIQQSMLWYDQKDAPEGLIKLYMSLPDSFKSFIEKKEFLWQIKEASENSSSKVTFDKRIFQWLDAFKILKYIHFSRDHYYKNEELVGACAKLIESADLSYALKSKNEIDMLEYFRKIDRESLLLDQMINI